MKTCAQVIDVAEITSIAKRIDSISYNGGPDSISIDGPSEVGRGTIKIENSIVGQVKSEDGEMVKHLSLAVHIAAEDGNPFYSLDIVASGLYKAASGMSSDEMDDALLTDGFKDLYAYARNIASIIMRGGPYGEPAMPILSVRVERG